MIRLFYGFSIPEDLRAVLCALQNGVPDMRWVPPQNLHLTLRFLGEIDENLAEELDHTVAEHLARHPVAPMTLEVRGIGVFGDGHRHRTVWAGVTAHPPLSQLQRTLETLAQRVGLPADGRVFHPHITLGKAKGKAAQDSLAARMASLTDYPFGVFQPEDLTLFQSHLGHSGPTYHDIASVPLSAAP